MATTEFPDALWIDYLSRMNCVFIVPIRTPRKVILASQKKICRHHEVQKVPELLNVVHSSDRKKTRLAIYFDWSLVLEN